MDDASMEAEHPKKRRRRRYYDRQPLSACLVLDDGLLGDIGIVSEDLWTKLEMNVEGARLHRQAELQDPTIFLAVRPWTPFAAIIEDIPWNILRVKKAESYITQDDKGAPLSIRIPAKSSSSHFFLHHRDMLDANPRLGLHHTTIDIQILNVKPLVLDTVYVAVEKKLLEGVDEAQKRFGGGFHQLQPTGSSGSGRSKSGNYRNGGDAYWNTSESVHSRLTKIVREALGESAIIHAGDRVDLPLPSHPITHLSSPPAIVTACEPVVQGLLSATTRIVLVQTESLQRKTTRQALPRVAKQHVVEDDPDDTSNEQFYSAAEDRQDEVDSGLDELIEQPDTDHSSQHDSDISDDSLEDMIALRAPDLPPHSSGLLVGTPDATPRPGVQRHTGTDTPGSLYSTYTSATARGGQRGGKVCRTEVLLQRLPIEALHPRPHQEDDEESFIFVDINTLTKIGCFSGDWVRLEKSKRPSMNRIGSLSLDGAGNLGEESSDWRAVRIFGLPNLASPKPRYALSEKRTSIFGSVPSSLTPEVYVPPMLLHNLRAPTFVKISRLFKSESLRASGHPKPQVAKEVTLRKLSTPISTKKEVQATLFALLKAHFQRCFRMVRAGDLIAIPFDEELGKDTFDVGQTAETDGEDVLSTKLAPRSSGRHRKPSIAWFLVDQIVPSDTDNTNGRFNLEEQWGSTFMVDALTTKMGKDGNSVQYIPEFLETNAALWHSFTMMRLRDFTPTLRLASGGSDQTPYVLPLQERLSNLVRSATSQRALSLGLPPVAILLHSTQHQIGKSYIASGACAAAGVHTFTISAHEVLADGGSSNGGGDSKTETSLKVRAERAFSCGSQFTAMILTHLEMLTADRMVSVLSDIISDSRVSFVTTTELGKIPDDVRSLFTHELEVTAPNEKEREGILHNACLRQGLQLDPSVSLNAVALKTAALVAGDLVDVVQRALLAHDRRLESLAVAKRVSIRDVQCSGGPLISNVTNADLNQAIGRARATFSDSIGAPKIPAVTWKDVGGLADQKSSIMETISLPLTRPELFAKGMRKRSGILFYGPPGTGKTLLAKAIATEFSLNFFSVKGPELLNMYIGESEANVRRIFQRARDARPCVVFFDELDSVAPKRGNQGDSGGVMDRIVSQLLAELDGMSSDGSSGKDGDGDATGNGGGVFVIGATNRPDLLDPALLRPGRFDKMLYLGVSSTHEQQLTILQALTRKFALNKNVDLARVAARLPFTYTGADLYALCSDAMLKAITRKTKQVDVKVQEASRVKGEEISTAYYFDHLATSDDTTVVVDEDDFVTAQRELVASVSTKELEHFERIRDQFEQQDVSSNAKDQRSSNEPPRLTTWSSLPMRQLDAGQSKHRTTGGVDPTTSVRERGKGKARLIGNPDSGPDDLMDSSDDGEGYQKFRTPNGTANSQKRKGKDTAKASTAMDGFVDTEDGELYAY